MEYYSVIKRNEGKEKNKKGGRGSGSGPAARGLAAASTDVWLPRPRRQPCLAQGSRHGAWVRKAVRRWFWPAHLLLLLLGCRAAPLEPGGTSTLLTAPTSSSSSPSPLAHTPSQKKDKKSFNQSIAQWKPVICNWTTGEFTGFLSYLSTQALGHLGHLHLPLGSALP